MSRKFRNDPVTVILGSRIKTGPDPKFLETHSPESAGAAPIVELTGLTEPLKTAAGRYVGSRIVRSGPLFEGGKVVGVITAWVNEAAKRRNGGDFAKAKPTEVVLVPLYRGIAASVLTYLKARRRRDIRLAQHDTRLVANANGSVEVEGSAA